MTSSTPPSTFNSNDFSNLSSIFDEVLERVITLSSINELFHSGSHTSKKKKNEEKQISSTNLFRSCEFKKILQLIRVTISSNLNPDPNSEHDIDRTYQSIIDNVRSTNSEIKASISRQSFILMNQMNSPIPAKPSLHQLKNGFKNELPDLKVIQHKKEIIDARISTTSAEIQLLETENIRITSQINQISNSKQIIIGNPTINNIDIEQKSNQIKYMKEKNAEIEKFLQNQQRHSSIFIQKERQEIDRFSSECENVQSQISSLESRIGLMSARANRQTINPTVPSINTAMLSKKSLQSNINPPQKKVQKRQRIVFRKPIARSKVVLTSLQPSFNESSNNNNYNDEMAINQDIGLMEEIAKNALLSVGDTMSTVATVTNVATASSSSQSAFDNRNEVENDDDDNPFDVNTNFNRKRRKTIGPSPYDIMESSSFSASSYPHPIDSLLDSKEEAQAAGIVGDDTCFYECPPNTEPSREIRLAPIPPFIPQDIPSENKLKSFASIKRNPSLASNLSRTSSSEPQPQKSELLSPSTINGSRPSSLCITNNGVNNNESIKEPIKMCTRSPLTDDLLRLPMPPVHMQNLMMQVGANGNVENENEMNNENENEGEVPLLLTKMPIMIRNSAEFFSRNNSQKRNMSPCDCYDEDTINSEAEKSNDETLDQNIINNNNPDINNREVVLNNNENNSQGFQIKEPKINLDHLPTTAERAPRPKQGVNQM